MARRSGGRRSSPNRKVAPDFVEPPPLDWHQPLTAVQLYDALASGMGGAHVGPESRPTHPARSPARSGVLATATPVAAPSRSRPRPARPIDANIFAGYSAEDRMRESAELICLERAQRREVLHAKNVAGKTGLNPPRYTRKSSVKC